MIYKEFLKLLLKGWFVEELLKILRYLCRGKVFLKKGKLLIVVTAHGKRHEYKLSQITTKNLN